MDISSGNTKGVQGARPWGASHEEPLHMDNMQGAADSGAQVTGQLPPLPGCWTQGLCPPPREPAPAPQIPRDTLWARSQHSQALAPEHDSCPLPSGVVQRRAVPSWHKPSYPHMSHVIWARPIPPSEEASMPPPLERSSLYELCHPGLHCATRGGYNPCYPGPSHDISVQIMKEIFSATSTGDKYPVRAVPAWSELCDPGTSQAIRVCGTAHTTFTGRFQCHLHWGEVPRMSYAIRVSAVPPRVVAIHAILVEPCHHSTSHATLRGELQCTSTRKKFPVRAVPFWEVLTTCHPGWIQSMLCGSEPCHQSASHATLRGGFQCHFHWGAAPSLRSAIWVQAMPFPECEASGVRQEGSSTLYKSFHPSADMPCHPGTRHAILVEAMPSWYKTCHLGRSHAIRKHAMPSWYKPCHHGTRQAMGKHAMPT
ncbi:hypothetical protein NDU88_000233 [Pleurodeles waltl]|uniref:Uncharacterized protein n=1 Tax=Pleurodeles waltl TaxID=8319 RepID=A0AAV7MHI2_PLEWA|nr:hypothetical protein NDU88_000233 [Pleurodeles waltl]